MIETTAVSEIDAVVASMRDYVLQMAKIKRRFEEPDPCAICTDPLCDGDIVSRPHHCKHWFHHACLKQWAERSPTCPTCRSDGKVLMRRIYRDRHKDHFGRTYYQVPHKVSKEVLVDAIHKFADLVALSP